LQGFARDLLESADNLSLAVNAVPAEKITPNNKDLKQLHEGVLLTKNVLIRTLLKHGISEFDPLGEKFDPNRHNALFKLPNPTKQTGVVGVVVKTGFKLHDRILRAAQVGVVENPPAAPQEPQKTQEQEPEPKPEPEQEQLIQENRSISRPVYINWFFCCNGSVSQKILQDLIPVNSININSKRLTGSLYTNLNNFHRFVMINDYQAIPTSCN